MKKGLFSLLLLILFSGAAWADSSNPSIYSDAVANKTDVSIAYLSSVFGTVSGVLTGTSGQMLGKLLYQFNQGMLVVAGCWLAFSVVVMVFKSAATGSFMQQDNKVPMILLRIALGFGLLIPNPSTGYTLLQGIVMQVAVQGVKLANQVWDYGLDYLSSGGVVWTPPWNYNSDNVSSAVNQDPSDVQVILGDINNSRVTVPDDYSTLSLVQKVMAMEACMVQMSINLTDTSGTDPDTLSMPSTSLSVYENLDNYSFEFPAGYATNTRSTGCGVVYWNSLAKKPNMDCTSGDDSSACGYSHLALKEVVNGLLPAVKKYVCLNSANADQSSVCSGMNYDDTDTTYMSDAMMSAFLNYQNLIAPVLRKDQSVTGDPLAFIGKARADGWMMAGRYYWDMMRVSDSYSGTAYYRNYIPDFKSYISPAAGTGAQPSNDALQTATNLMTSSIGYISTANQQLNNFSTASSAGSLPVNPTNYASVGTKGGLKFVIGLLFPVITDLYRIIITFSSVSYAGLLGPDPVLWLHNLGMECLSFGINIWIGLAGTAFGIMLVAGVFSCISSVGAAVQGLISWLKPFLLVISGAFILIGVTLGFYLPLYPYILFTFGVIGWIIFVVEAMVAAPLVALGVTHPEGHDFLGKAQQAVMLCLSLFLQPVLMLIGLFVGMILCQVSLGICLYTFSSFCSDIFSITGSASGAPSGDLVLQAAGTVMGNVWSNASGSGLAEIFMPLIVFPLFLAIFAVIVYIVTVTSFSTVYHLPNYIMLWIGAPQGHGINAQNMSDQLKQGMSGVMGKATGGAEAGARGFNYIKPPKDGELNAPANNNQGGNAGAP